MVSRELSQEWLRIFFQLNEKEKRWFAAVKALELGYGGVNFIHSQTNLARSTITRAINEIKNDKLTGSDKIRDSGGGRKSFSKMTSLENEINKILSETTAGNSMNHLKWTGKSVRTIADELNRKGYVISFKSVARILKKLDYSLQANIKTLSRASDTNRNEQFEKINSLVASFIKSLNPVISVDAKKKEQVGKFKNSGQTWRKSNDPKKVEDHDYKSRSSGNAIPYGTYDVKRNEGFVNVGISKNTAEFAVNSIFLWWKKIGKKNYPNAKKILICADGGGSNGSTNKLWKVCLQNFANASGLKIFISHYPPGTSKWNKIEHRMFSYISINWRGVPLESYETIINLISNTRTKAGLKIKAQMDTSQYESGIKISDKEFSELNIKHDVFLPKWNYIISPHKL